MLINLNMGAAGNIDEKYKTLGGFQYDANQITGAMDLLKEQGTRDQFDNMVGRSNMADVGGQQRNLMDQGIAQERQKRLLSNSCLLYTSPSPRDRQKSRMPSSA